MLEIIHVVVHIIMKQTVYLLTGMDRWMDSYYYLNARRNAFIHQAMVSEFGLVGLVGRGVSDSNPNY